MTARGFLFNITIILTVIAVGALIETAVPMFVAHPWRQGRRAANLGLTAVAFLMNWLLASVAAIAALTLRPARALAHGNIRLWPGLDRVLSLFWVTPNVHKIHHSREVSETNSNYANLLTIYDRLLGTYTPSDRAESVIYGLNDAERMSKASFPALVAMPFQTADRTGAEPPERRIRLGPAQVVDTRVMLEPAKEWDR